MRTKVNERRKRALVRLELNLENPNYQGKERIQKEIEILKKRIK